ncbi:hypothetical protein ON010_g8265 [Phytophthora cinnamomi]|nr:hypothetical protein ON010_g8265 [Phytophthora cinnamomi]
MADADYYETLGIQKTATEDEIKRAYRKLAIRYHPGPSPASCCAVKRRRLMSPSPCPLHSTRCFRQEPGQQRGGRGQVQGDRRGICVQIHSYKRRQYDRFGKAGVGGAAGGGGAGPGMHPFQGQDAEEIFRTFFGGQDPFSMFFQEGMRGGGGMHNFGGSRVHVSQFGPGFTFTSFGGAPGMGMPGMRVHRVNQRQRWLRRLY